MAVEKSNDRVSRTYQSLHVSRNRLAREKGVQDGQSPLDQAPCSSSSSPLWRGLRANVTAAEFLKT